MTPSRPHSATTGFRVVAMGGGTGLSSLLRGLKKYVPAPGADPNLCSLPVHISDLAAVVTVTDDGGSSGRLRKDFNMLPPGDLRNCMVALSTDETLLSRLFQHRFRGTGALEGHSFGNLFLAALAEMTGDFAHAVQLAAEVLATCGHIFPATSANVTLTARMADGSLVRGETNITASRERIVELMLEPANVEPLPATLEAIRRADLITLGPGSLFTSVITNLLVSGIPEALAAAHATRVYVVNLMTQANESLGLTASQHIERIYEHVRHSVFDYALVNTGAISAELRQRYAAEGAEVILPDVDRIEALGVRCITGNFAAQGGLVRHASAQVAEALLHLALENQHRHANP